MLCSLASMHPYITMETTFLVSNPIEKHGRQTFSTQKNVIHVYSDQIKQMLNIDRCVASQAPP